jgi:hypothetical protein
MSCCASTPRRHCCPRSALRCKAMDTFRPGSFSLLRRFTPHTGLGSIAPRNRMEFAAFPSFAPTYCQPKPTTDGRQSLFPARAVHTLRRIPLACSRTASLRPLPSCCSVASRPLRTPKCSTRPSLRANKRRHLHHSFSRSCQSASAAPSVSLAPAPQSRNPVSRLPDPSWFLCQECAQSH